jgi:hypothetical protein
MRASTKAWTPCETVSRLRRITPLRSRNVNVRVARPAPSSNVRVVWNADACACVWRVPAALVEGAIRRTSETAIERARTQEGREVTEEIRVWSPWESSIRARSGGRSCGRRDPAARVDRSSCRLMPGRHFHSGSVATLVLLGVVLVIPSIASADLGLFFPSPRAQWGQRITVSSASRYAPFSGVRVYLVPMALARSSRVQRPTGPPPSPRIVMLGPLRLTHTAVARLTFVVPRVPHGDYTIGFWCRPCAPPAGAFFTTAQPGERWKQRRPARILRISR